MAKHPKFFGKTLQLSWSELAIGIAAIALGLVLTIHPDLATSVVFNAVGIAAIVIGGIHLARYFMQNQGAAAPDNGMFVGAMWVVGGILLIALKGLLLSLLPFLFGLVLLVGGIGKLQYTLNFKRMGASRWYLELAAAVVSTVFGLLILVNPFSTAMVLMRIIGVALLVEGVQDLISHYAYKKTSEAYYVEFEDR